MTYTIKPIDGRHCIVDGDKVISSHDTNAKAWWALDKLNNEAYNRKEASHDWAAKQFLERE